MDFSDELVGPADNDGAGGELHQDSANVLQHLIRVSVHLINSRIESPERAHLAPVKSTLILLIGALAGTGRMGSPGTVREQWFESEAAAKQASGSGSRS